MKRTSIVHSLFVLSFLFTALQISFAQEAGSIPANWQELPAHEFSHAVIEPFKAGKLTGTEERAIGQHAHKFLMAVDLEQVGTDRFLMLDELYELSRDYLEETEIEAMIAAMGRRSADNWEDRPYTEMRSKVAFMEWLKMPLEDIIKEATAWFDAGGPVTEVWDEDLSLLPYYVNRGVEVIDGSFSVRWEGRVVAPRTGEYTFSISSIDVNDTVGTYHIKQTMSIKVNGSETLSATPENWSNTAKPVQLTANQPTPIVVEMKVETLTLPMRELHAVLFWEGPGISKSVVPGNQFKLATTDETGLRATYNWLEDGEPQQRVQVVTGIDHNWSSGKVLLADGETNDWQLWFKSMQADYLNGLETNEGTHTFLVDPVKSAGSLSTEQRSAFLNELLARPTMVSRMKTRQAADLYRAFRVGAPENALDVFGLWATQHADCVCEFPKEAHFSGIDYDQREDYRNLAVCMGQELPSQITRLQEEYLEMSDGSCSLPVAYILAYHYLGQKQLKEWVRLVDSRLNDENLTGEKRVNWLIAKAHSTEIRLCSHKIRRPLKERVTDGMVWLDEASLIATTPQTKLRVAQERAVRLSSIRKHEKARGAINDIAASIPADLTHKVEHCRDCINTFESQHQQQVSDQQNAAKQARITRLQTRLQKATARGDGRAVARFQSLLSQVESE